MVALLSALYSVLAYLFFLATFLYAIGFVEGAVVPKGIDSGVVGDTATAIIINVILLGIFALQHSIMARRGFKRAWTRIIPSGIERSTYVLFSTLALALLIWQWRPLPRPVWSMASGPMADLIQAISLIGWAIVLVSTFLISHFQLFGLTQGFAGLLGRQPRDMPFETPLFYRWIRHPIYAGFIIAFWAAPTMSAGHLLFTVLCTGYILVGVWFEERDLIAQFGDRYRQYRQSVGMLVPRPARRSRGTAHRA